MGGVDGGVAVGFGGYRISSVYRIGFSGYQGFLFCQSMVVVSG